MHNTNFLRISSFFFRFAIALSLALSWISTLPAEPVQAAPNISFFKVVSSGMYPGPGAGQYTITYDIIVFNRGTNGSYTLIDTPQFGSGVTIISAEYTRYRFNGTDGPFALSTTGPWTLASGQSLNGGRQDLYTIEVVVNPSGASGDALDCTLQSGETGTGMRNQAVLSGGGSGTSIACDPIRFQELTITSFQSYVPLDSNKSCEPGQEGPDAMFYEIEVYNSSGSIVNDVTVTLENFTAATTAPAKFSGSVGLDSGETAARTIQSIAPGSVEHLFWYINYPCYDGSYSPPPDWTWFFDVTVEQGGSSFAYERSLTTRSEISANLAIVESTSLGAGIYLGQVIPYTVDFQLKTIGVNQDVYLQPAGNVEFNSACYRLMGMDVTAVSGGTDFTSSITTADDNDIYYLDVTAQGASNYITVVYYFLVTCDNGISSSFPFTDIGSGTQYKYTETDTEDWPNVTNSMSIDKQTLDPVFSQGGGEHEARFVITITNTATQDVYIDEIVDILPTGEDIEDPFVDCSGPTFSGDYTLPPNSRQVTQSISYSYPAQNDTGTVKWIGNQVDFVPPVAGEYRVPANNGTNDGKLVLCYTANVQDVTGQYTDTASANASGNSIGQDTATVTVGDAALNIEKTGSLDITASAPTGYANPGDVINYTFTVTNIGTVTLNNISVTDPLVSTITCGSDNTPPQIASLTANSSIDCTGSYTITLADVEAGTKNNTVTADSDETEPVTDSHTESIPQPPLLTLRKSWVDGVNGDTSQLSIDGTNDDTDTSTSDGTVGLLTDTTNTASVFAYPGETVSLSEVLGVSNTGSYATGLSCSSSDGTLDSALTYTPGSLSGSLLIDSDDADSSITCTFTNTRSATLVLQKAWTNGANGDTAQLSIDGTNDNTDTSTSSGAAGTQTDTTNTASVTVYVDETVNLSETLGGSNNGSYTIGLSCNSSDGTLDSALTYTSGALNGSLQIEADDAGSTITCTFTNTRQTATLNLNKEWANATVNDTADLSLNGVNDDLNNTSNADSSAETDPSVASITVYTGETVQISESYGAGNSKSYNAALACNSGDGTLDSVLTYTSGALSGSLQIAPNDADGTITCTFTNTGSAVTLYSVTVVKDLIPSTDDGRFDLSVQVGTGSAAVVANDAGDGDSGTQGGIAENASVTVAETAQSPAILANYGTPSLECLTASQQSVSVTNGNFTMPDENVTCTFTNTRVSATLIFRKAWVNGSGGDFTDLSIDLGGQNLAQGTSTSTGGDETNDIASATVYKGQTITLSEALDANNSSEYTRALNCSNNLGTLTYTPGAAIGSLLIDPESPGGEIYCTFTNTASEEPNLFDPPSAVKVLSADGLPEIEFTMTWINDSNTAAINVQIEDLIPAGTTFVDVPTNSLVCEDDIDGNGGQTNTTTCEYRTGPNRIFWEGTIGPDPGAANATEANDELVITFRVLVPDSVNEVENQGTSLTDRDNDNDFTDETTEASVAVSNIVRWTRTPEIDPPISRNRVPDTGFTPGVVTKLPEQPSDLAYLDLGAIWMEIPSLKVKSTIVGVPLSGDSWDTSWLYRETGWLEGSAFPTWQGNSVVTAHVYTADGKPGPFVDVKELKYDDQIIVHILGQKYTFAVRDNKMILPRNSSYAFAHMEDGSYLTLITCQGYNPLNDTYLFRRVVRAVLVKVE